MLVDADKSSNYISKKVAGTFGPNTSIIAPGETPLLQVKKALEKLSVISKQQRNELAENKISTPRIVGKKALRNLQPFQSCKKRNMPKIKALHHLQQARKPLRNLL
jgi:hypothetical protein